MTDLRNLKLGDEIRFAWLPDTWFRICHSYGMYGTYRIYNPEHLEQGWFCLTRLHLYADSVAEARESTEKTRNEADKFMWRRDTHPGPLKYTQIRLKEIMDKVGRVPER